MLTTLLALVVAQQASPFPKNPDFDYSGIPMFDAPGDMLQVRSHSATIEVGETFADVATVTELRNLSGNTLRVHVTVPRYRLGPGTPKAPDFNISASINKHPLTLEPPQVRGGPLMLIGDAVQRHNELQTTLYLAPNTSYGFRTSYRVPVGRAGVDHKLRLVGYALARSFPIGNLSISYRTAAASVFHLPRPLPDLGWQIGPRGAYAKLSNFTPHGQVTYVTFYSGGFEDIGNKQ